MLDFFYDLVSGWTEVRTQFGYSYQVSRNGKRRAVAVENYGRRGEIDQKWIETGEFTDTDFHKRLRNYHLTAARSPRRIRRVLTEDIGFRCGRSRKVRLGRTRSSVGQSIGFLIRRSQVRILPGALIARI